MQGASAVIPNGYRVVSVQVDSVSGSTLILPGDRVDVLVYLVGNAQHGIPETSTRTVLQDIKVFAVNDVVDMDKDKEKSISSKTISLLATPAARRAGIARASPRAVSSRARPAGPVRWPGQGKCPGPD